MTDIDLSSLPPATGYSTTEVYYGTRFIQGGRTNYLLDLSLRQIMSIVPQPNPQIASPGNRRINEKHALDFATYQRQTPKWVVPGILLRIDHAFEFKSALPAESGVQFGAISFPRTAASDIHILDGQHRILGLYKAYEQILADRAKLEDSVASAKRIQDHAAAAELQRGLDEINKQAKRFEDEHIPVQIIVEANAAAYRQMFFDIAENAKGITASVRARFDSRKAVNRALVDVLEHPLLANRTETEADRLKRGSMNFTTAKYVTEIMRTLVNGYDARIGKRMESQLSDKQVAKTAMDFYDQLVDAFPILKNMIAGNVTPDTVRSTTLFGSNIFIRILAAVRHDLMTDHAFTRQMVTDFFAKLAPHIEVPIHENSLLLREIGTPRFQVDTFAPSARRQDAAYVVEKLTSWAIDKPAFLDEKPLPAPPKAVPLEEKPVEEMTEEEHEEILRPETHRARSVRREKSAAK